ncbi:MAG: hypothetical protein HY594_00750 [Candidatus Omnitrophica bacterium]|nr:hypothetical protein [Candidatus Omnitrophota bacterium]
MRKLVVSFVVPAFTLASFSPAYALKAQQIEQSPQILSELRRAAGLEERPSDREVVQWFLNQDWSRLSGKHLDSHPYGLSGNALPQFWKQINTILDPLIQHGAVTALPSLPTGRALGECRQHILDLWKHYQANAPPMVTSLQVALSPYAWAMWEDLRRPDPYRPPSGISLDVWWFVVSSEIDWGDWAGTDRARVHLGVQCGDVWSVVRDVLVGTSEGWRWQPLKLRDPNYLRKQRMHIQKFLERSILLDRQIVQYHLRGIAKSVRDGRNADLASLSPPVAPTPLPPIPRPLAALRLDAGDQRVYRVYPSNPTVIVPQGGGPPITLQMEKGGVPVAATFSPGGRFFAVVESPKGAVLQAYDPSKGQLINGESALLPRGVRALAFSPNGNNLYALVAGEESASIRLIDLLRGSEGEVLVNSLPAGVQTFAVSEEMAYVVVDGRLHRYFLWSGKAADLPVLSLGSDAQILAAHVSSERYPENLQVVWLKDERIGISVHNLNTDYRQSGDAPPGSEQETVLAPGERLLHLLRAIAPEEPIHESIDRIRQSQPNAQFKALEKYLRSHIPAASQQLGAELLPWLVEMRRQGRILLRSEQEMELSLDALDRESSQFFHDGDFMDPFDAWTENLRLDRRQVLLRIVLADGDTRAALREWLLEKDASFLRRIKASKSLSPILSLLAGRRSRQAALDLLTALHDHGDGGSILEWNELKDTGDLFWGLLPHVYDALVEWYGHRGEELQVALAGYATQPGDFIRRQGVATTLPISTRWWQDEDERVGTADGAAVYTIAGNIWKQFGNSATAGLEEVVRTSQAEEDVYGGML